MVADLVAKKISRCLPQQDLLVSLARGSVAMGGEFVFTGNRGCIVGWRGAEQDICIMHLKRWSFDHHIDINVYYYCPTWVQVCLCLQIFVPCVQVCLYLLPELKTMWNSHRHLTHQSRNSQCSRVGYFSAGCRNLVYTDHIGLQLRSPEDTWTKDTLDKWQSKTSDSACGQVTLVEYVHSDDATVFTLQMQALQGSVLMLPDRLHSQRTHWG